MPACLQIDMDASALNIVRPHVLQQAVQWAESASGTGSYPHIDTKQVFVFGHSLGVWSVRDNSNDWFLVLERDVCVQIEATFRKHARCATAYTCMLARCIGVTDPA